MDLIKENNEDIDLLTKYLTIKVEELKKKGLSVTVKNAVEEFYNDVIIPWQENFMLDNKEPNNTEDINVKNKILDMINYINRILRK